MRVVYISFIVCLANILLLLESTSGSGFVVETATLGATGFSFEDTLAGEPTALNVLPTVFQGVRFEVAAPTRVSAIGGHFLRSDPPVGSTVFGGIVLLDGPDDFPDSTDLATSDVLGAALIDLPDSSQDVLSPLDLLLQPGHYAAVFGSGLFGADGFGAAPLVGDSLLSSEAFFFGQPNAVTFYGNIPEEFGLEGQRFLVQGVAIPEPTTASLVMLGLMLAGMARHTRK